MWSGVALKFATEQLQSENLIRMPTPLKVLILLAFAAVAFSAPTARVFLIIGQSNSVGHNVEGRTAEDTTDPRIRQTTCCDNGVLNLNNCRITGANDPLPHYCDLWFVNSDNIGFGMSFARQLVAELQDPEDFIVLVPAGIDGTGFADNVWPAYSGTGFQAAVARLAATFRVLASDFPTVAASFDGILWHQGETDAFVSTDTYLYNDIIPMIQAWRDTALIPQTSNQLPFVVGNLVPSWVQDPSQTQRLGVATALETLPQLVPFTGSAPSTGLVGGAADEVHFSAPSHRIFGKRYFDAYKAALQNNIAPAL